MNKKKVLEIIPNERIIKRIFWLRGKKVMFDSDLAEMYGVETKVLNQAVKRNVERFPNDFVFRPNVVKKTEVITNCDHLAQLKLAKSQRYAFTARNISGLTAGFRQSPAT